MSPSIESLYPSELTPRIIFEDAHLIVLSKPAGLLSQGEHTGDLNLVDWLRGYLGRNYVGLVHRLDRNTSGIMIVAKRSKAAQRLTDALQKGTLTRSYQAWLIGVLPTAQNWSHLLLKDEKRNRVRVLPREQPGAKRATLKVLPICYGKLEGTLLTLAEFKLETGRSHQIRVQAAAEKLPLLGDLKYGPNANAGIRFGRPALHSVRLTLTHPMPDLAPLSFEDPLPADMLGIKSVPLNTVLLDPLGE